MNTGECNCLEMSSQEDDDSFKVEGGFCRKNSVKL